MAIVRRDISDIREEYSRSKLEETDVLQDPVQQFEKWFFEAQDAKVKEPNAMVLSTVSVVNKPSSRIVLLKDIKPEGFSFYTNYDSRKGSEIDSNPNVSLLFFWQELQRQVRIEGIVEKLSLAESDEYFASRPRESRIGAIASPQSHPLESRAVLESKVEQTTLVYQDIETIPRPENWGGYLVRPVVMEFWQGRASRLHDRLVYMLEDQAWIVKRLAP